MIPMNYFAILVAGIVSMVVGFFWYGPMMFGNPWMKLMGYTKESMEKAKKGMMKTYATSFIFTLISAYVLWYVMVMSQNFFGYDKMMTGFSTAFWMWLGFMMPVQATEVLFGGKKWKLFGINTGYQLVSLLVMGAVMGIMM